MENLTLPEPVRTTWERTREVVKNAIARIAPGERYCLGGGTVLAARWRHRQSFDVDIQMPEHVRIELLAGEAGEELRQRINDLGGRSGIDEHANIYSGWLPSRDRYAREAVQIWGREPGIGGGETEAIVDGRREWTLGTTQILHGKLARADKRTVRDMFDLWTAARKAPGALEDAVNARSRRSILIVTDDWADRREETETWARIALRGVSRADELRFPELGRLAAEAVGNARYRELAIIAGSGRITTRTTTVGGARRRRTTTPDRAGVDFERWGLNAHLSARDMDTTSVLAAVRQAARHAEETTVVAENDEEIA